MKILGYLILFLLLCYLFFLWQFPSDQLKSWVTGTLPETSPVKLTIGEIKPKIPFTLLIKKNHLQSDLAKIRFSDIYLTPNLVNLLIGRASFGLENTGSIRTLQAKYRQEGNLSKIEVWLKEFEATALFPNGSSLTAKVSGEGTLQWNGNDYASGEGQGWLLIRRGEINPKEISSLPPPLNFFDKAEAEFQFKQGILFLKRIELTGGNQQKITQPDLQIPLKGGVNFSTGTPFSRFR